MTGPGGQGGPPRRDPWRGARTDSRGSGAPLAPVSSHVEVEELPTQALLPRAKSRFPLTGALAVAGIAVLLAGGFGFLGGRPGLGLPSPIPSSLAGAPSTAPTATAKPAEPRVTPWAPCGGAADRPPEPILEVDGTQHLGHADMDYRDPDPDVENPAEEPRLGQPERVEVPMDAVTGIWISGGRCALEWYISLKADAEPVPIVLESVSNLGLDSSVASQNRFELFVAPHAGDYDLRALFTFDDVAVRATWPIHVPELTAPDVTLRAGEREIQTVLGCDVTRRLANDLEEPLNPCGRDVAREPARRADVETGELLTFEIDGWVPTSTYAYCGQLTDRSFIPRVEPPCFRERDSQFAGTRFPAPDEAGAWTLAIQTCATRLRATGKGFEELCGTWYANVRVGT